MVSFHFSQLYLGNILHVKMFCAVKSSCNKTKKQKRILIKHYSLTRVKLDIKHYSLIRVNLICIQLALITNQVCYDKILQ